MTRTLTRRSLSAMVALFLAIPLVGISLLALVADATRKPAMPDPGQPDTSCYRCTTPDQLESALAAEGVPFPETFVRVAIYETGWRFTDGVGIANNLFGMRCSGRVDSCVVGRDGAYSAYRSRMHAVRDLKRWADLRPPDKGMDGEQWLVSRGWNSSPMYWQYISTIEP